MPAPWTCLRIVVSDGSVKNFISVTWNPAGLRGPQARVPLEKPSNKQTWKERKYSDK